MLLLVLVLHRMSGLQRGGALVKGVRGSCRRRVRLEDLVRSLLLLRLVRWVEDLLRELCC